jgi:hypothetical protein
VTALPKLVVDNPEIRPDLYHGIIVLHLHVDDPIPTPRAPERYAVRVSPDLARYLLSKNHPKNRKHKPTAIAKYARDMEQGYWAFTPESIVFSNHGVLEDGQNRLRAVEQSGVTVWIMFDFGWPEDLIQCINRASSRTNADALTVNGYPGASGTAGAMGIVEKYLATVGTPLRWSQRLLTSSESVERFTNDPDEWATAGQWGMRVYNATQGLGPATWTAAYFVVAKARGADTASAFFQAVIDETDEPGAATRKLKSHILRRHLKDTASGDSREPMENIVRAFNAWSAGRPVGFVRTGGAFVLSPVRKG